MDYESLINECVEEGLIAGIKVKYVTRKCLTKKSLIFEKESRRATTWVKKFENALKNTARRLGTKYIVCIYRETGPRNGSRYIFVSNHEDVERIINVFKGRRSLRIHVIPC